MPGEVERKKATCAPRALAALLAAVVSPAGDRSGEPDGRPRDFALELRAAASGGGAKRRTVPRSMLRRRLTPRTLHAEARRGKGVGDGGGDGDGGGGDGGLPAVPGVPGSPIVAAGRRTDGEGVGSAVPRVDFGNDSRARAERGGEGSDGTGHGVGVRDVVEDPRALCYVATARGGEDAPRLFEPLSAGTDVPGYIEETLNMLPDPESNFDEEREPADVCNAGAGVPKGEAAPGETAPKRNAVVEDGVENDSPSSPPRPLPAWAPPLPSLSVVADVLGQSCTELAEEPRDALEALARACHFISVPNGTVVARAGQRVGALMFVLSGSLTMAAVATTTTKKTKGDRSARGERSPRRHGAGPGGNATPSTGTGAALSNAWIAAGARRRRRFGAGKVYGTALLDPDVESTMVTHTGDVVAGEGPAPGETAAEPTRTEDGGRAPTTTTPKQVPSISGFLLRVTPAAKRGASNGGGLPIPSGAPNDDRTTIALLTPRGIASALTSLRGSPQTRFAEKLTHLCAHPLLRGWRHSPWVKDLARHAVRVEVPVGKVVVAQGEATSEMCFVASGALRVQVSAVVPVGDTSRATALMRKFGAAATVTTVGAAAMGRRERNKNIGTGAGPPSSSTASPDGGGKGVKGRSNTTRTWFTQISAAADDAGGGGGGEGERDDGGDGILAIHLGEAQRQRAHQAAKEDERRRRVMGREGRSLTRRVLVDAATLSAGSHFGDMCLHADASSGSGQASLSAAGLVAAAANFLRTAPQTQQYNDAFGSGAAEPVSRSSSLSHRSARRSNSDKGGDDRKGDGTNGGGRDSGDVVDGGGDDDNDDDDDDDDGDGDGDKSSFVAPGTVRASVPTVLYTVTARYFTRAVPKEVLAEAKRYALDNARFLRAVAMGERDAERPVIKTTGAAGGAGNAKNNNNNDRRGNAGSMGTFSLSAATAALRAVTRAPGHDLTGDLPTVQQRERPKKRSPGEVVPCFDNTVAATINLRHWRVLRDRDARIRDREERRRRPATASVHVDMVGQRPGGGDGGGSNRTDTDHRYVGEKPHQRRGKADPRPRPHSSLAVLEGGGGGGDGRRGDSDASHSPGHEEDPIGDVFDNNNDDDDDDDDDDDWHRVAVADPSYRLERRPLPSVPRLSSTGSPGSPGSPAARGTSGSPAAEKPAARRPFLAGAVSSPERGLARVTRGPELWRKRDPTSSPAAAASIMHVAKRSASPTTGSATLASPMASSPQPRSAYDAIGAVLAAASASPGPHARSLATAGKGVHSQKAQNAHATGASVIEMETVVGAADGELDPALGVDTTAIPTTAARPKGKAGKGTIRFAPAEPEQPTSTTKTDASVAGLTVATLALHEPDLTRGSAAVGGVRAVPSPDPSAAFFALGSAGERENSPIGPALESLKEADEITERLIAMGWQPREEQEEG